MQILIILYKTIIIKRISNESKNELTIYAILCRNVPIFYRQELAFLFKVKEKLKTYRNLKWNFSSSCFITHDSHVKVLWLNVIVFTEYYILHFWNHAHLLKYYPVKVLQNCFNPFNCPNQTGVQVSKFSFDLDR